jgi:hypothetical protein
MIEMPGKMQLAQFAAARIVLEKIEGRQITDA